MYVRVYAYVCMCVCVYVGFIICLHIFIHCLKGSMYEYSYVDYIVFHVHIEKKV